MSIKDATLMDGATSASTTGGSSLLFSDVGVEIKNGVHVSAASVSDFRVRPYLVFTNRPSVLQNDGTWSKEKRKATLVVPRLLDDGVTYGFELIRIESETYPDKLSADRVGFRLNGAQILTDPDFEAYWDAGSLA